MSRIGKTPLLEALLKNKRFAATPFHMPGHKKGQGLYRKFAQAMQVNPFSLDMTEIPGLDDLHTPTGPIMEAQRKAATLFGADNTFFLVNGTTVGIHAAILATVKEKEEIVLPRDVHRSVIGACILSGAMPRYIPARFDDEFLVPLPPTPEQFSLALDKYKGVKAVMCLYPSYYGLAGNLEAITNKAHKYNIPVIVDEAHGAHFAFSDTLPPSALSMGVDISIQSTHKTLGALTQASMLHVHGRIVQAGEIARQLKILQSTSPSYILMASLDASTAQLEVAGNRLLNKTVDLAYWMRHEITKIKGLRCLGETILEHKGVCSFDPTKLYISFGELGLTGTRVADILRKKYKIQVELSDRYSILCMVSLGNTKQDAQKLVEALRQIASNTRPLRSKRHNSLDYNSLPLPQAVLTPREAWFSSKKKVNLSESVGRIAAEMVAPYPPGIPLICPGEKITEEIIDIIGQLKADKSSFHGPEDADLSTVSVVDE